MQHSLLSHVFAVSRQVHMFIYVMSILFELAACHVCLLLYLPLTFMSHFSQHLPEFSRNGNFIPDLIVLKGCNTKSLVWWIAGRPLWRLNFNLWFHCAAQDTWTMIMTEWKLWGAGWGRGFPHDPTPKYHLNWDYIAQLSFPIPNSKSNRVQYSCLSFTSVEKHGISWNINQAG